MSRLRFLDMLQVYPFWLFDVSGWQGNPLITIFDPTFGFSAITAPEITLEHREIQPGNWEYKRRAVKTADVGAITLSRGARFYDSDFYIWSTNAIKGNQPVRRNLFLVHFFGFRPLGRFIGGNGVRDKSDVMPDEIALTSIATRLPARAWYLSGCLPVRYKAGGDFDAAAGDVSIQEFEVQPEYVEEITVATASPITARLLSLGLATAEAAGAF